jgi:hypothetical protein
MPQMETLAPACSNCADLRYELFTEHDDPQLRRKGRYHISTFHKLHLSVQAGCKLCLIIYRGLSCFWREVLFDDLDVDEMTDRTTMEEEEESPSEDQRLSSTNIDEKSAIGQEDQDIREDDETSSDDAVPINTIFMELRPGHSLTIFRDADFGWGFSMTSETCNYIEFYTQMGDFPQ